MSEMASWFKTKEGFLFLTDDDVKAYHEQRGLENIRWNDFVGHGGLMRVFRLEDGPVHQEGFVGMPEVIRKHVLDGKMDMLFAHAGNLREATPEFIPMMKRLANRFKHVREQLKANPYVETSPRQKLTNFKQLEIGIKSGFTGSSIGELLRHPACTEEGMMLALTNPSSVQYMDDSGDNHHYVNIIDHRNITKKVLRFIVDNSKNESVVAYAKDKLSGFVVRKARRMKRLQELKIKTIRRGKAKIRVAV